MKKAGVGFFWKNPALAVCCSMHKPRGNFEGISSRNENVKTGFFWKVRVSPFCCVKLLLIATVRSGVTKHKRENRIFLKSPVLACLLTPSMQRLHGASAKCINYHVHARPHSDMWESLSPLELQPQYSRTTCCRTFASRKSRSRSFQLRWRRAGARTNPTPVWTCRASVWLLASLAQRSPLAFALLSQAI